MLYNSIATPYNLINRIGGAQGRRDNACPSGAIVHRKYVCIIVDNVLCASYNIGISLVDNSIIRNMAKTM